MYIHVHIGRGIKRDTTPDGFASSCGCHVYFFDWLESCFQSWCWRSKPNLKTLWIWPEVMPICQQVPTMQHVHLFTRMKTTGRYVVPQSQEAAGTWHIPLQFYCPVYTVHLSPLPTWPDSTEALSSSSYWPAPGDRQSLRGEIITHQYQKVHSDREMHISLCSRHLLHLQPYPWYSLNRVLYSPL